MRKRKKGNIKIHEGGRARTDGPAKGKKDDEEEEELFYRRRQIDWLIRRREDVEKRGRLLSERICRLNEGVRSLVARNHH